MRKALKYTVVFTIVALSVFSYFYVNDIKTHSHLPNLTQIEMSTNHYNSEESDRNMLPESKVVKFFVDKVTLLLSPVFNQN
ncbi:MAG: hypothetical protein EA362_04205 [Saprospirales bacterium]|nr:MAG: hypothetical protein EA362_04205 [Saprospirales bacterium]